MYIYVYTYTYTYDYIYIPLATYEPFMYTSLSLYTNHSSQLVFQTSSRCQEGFPLWQSKLVNTSPICQGIDRNWAFGNSMPNDFEIIPQ